MKRFCFLAVLIALTSSAHAGRSISFSVGSHRVHMDRPGIAVRCRAPRCRSPEGPTGAASATAMRVIAMRPCRQSLCRQCHRRFRHRPRRRPRRRPRPSSSRRRRPSTRRPHRRRCLAFCAVHAATGGTGLRLQCRRHRQMRNRSRRCSLRRRSSASRIRPRKNQSDSPIGDWQTEGKGAVRIAKCGNALCGYVLSPSSNEKGEAILINMKPKTERQWTGGVFSHESRRHLLRHDGVEGEQHASRRSLRAPPLLLLRQQLEAHHAPADSLITSRLYFIGAAIVDPLSGILRILVSRGKRDSPGHTRRRAMAHENARRPAAGRFKSSSGREV